ncbi:MAG: hypothetical protein AB7E81_03885 [Hyphomicrobiaceae bacterium]
MSRRIASFDAGRGVGGVPSRLASVVAAAVLHLFFVIAPVWAADPKVPPGRDPGGIAVAIIGGGLDYRRQELASRIARDGEGELIGWDFVDENRTPFAAAGGSDPVVGIIVAESSARLLAVRVANGEERQIPQAFRFIRDTPARVALLVTGPAAPVERGNLVMAARQLTQVLIVVPARLVAPESPGAPATGDASGLLVVAAVGSVAKGDVSVEADAGAAVGGETHPDDVAAARIAALAVRLISKESLLAGSALRERLIGLAKARPDGSKLISGIDHLP